VAVRAAGSRPPVETEPEGSRGIGRWLIGLLCATVANAAALILVFAAARAIYYPFWAARASRDELDRSWGGPGTLGATVAHWAVAAATIAVMYAVILLMERLARHDEEVPAPPSALADAVASTAITKALAGRLDPRFLSRSELVGGHPRRGRPA
jgi:hypothetical protein